MADASGILCALRAVRAQRSKNYVELEGKLYYTRYAVESRAYITVYENFVRKDPDMRITLQLYPFDLYLLAEAAQSAGQGGGSDHRFFTRSAGGEKALWFTVDDDAQGVYLNFQRTGKGGRKNIALLLTPAETLALAAMVRDFTASLLRREDEVAWGRDSARWKKELAASKKGS